MKIVGVEHRTGNFKGFDYDNYIIHVLEDKPFGSCIAGDLTDTYKVRARSVKDVFGGLIESEKDFGNIIGCNAEILCNKYGDPLRITVKM